MSNPDARRFRVQGNGLNCAFRVQQAADDRRTIRLGVLVDLEGDKATGPARAIHASRRQRFPLGGEIQKRAVQELF